MLSLPTRPSRPLAWGALLATLALLGATPALGARLAATVGGDGASPEVLSASPTADQTTTADQASADGDLNQAAPCGTPGPSALSIEPSSPVVVQPAAVAVDQPPTAAAASSDLQASFRLCGGSDPPTARAIEQLIAGRSFSASLNSRSADNCADLSIHVSPQSAGAGSQSISLSVSAGNPPRPVTVQITSDNGATHASIGGGQ
jgi:hypothetical protein